MADWHEDRPYHYVTGLSKDTLDDYWEELLKRHADFYEPEEIKFFVHCTSMKKKDSILKIGRLEGGLTGLPKQAPLASNPELFGVWLAPCTAILPDKSPYGNHRLCIKAKDLISYMFQSPEEDRAVDSDDVWDAESSEDDTCGGKGKKGKGGKKGKEQTTKKKQKQRKPKKNQKECYATGHKSAPPQKQRGNKPMLFFECAHYYGNTQYVRMLLVRAGDPQSDWCVENLKEVNIHDNPFFHLKWGRLYSSIGEHGRKELVVEVLIVGDIVLDKVPGKVTWETVGKLQRAGFDPRIGVL